tara:strand:- start:21810 stop:23498 length:1689 start_codon:yes stop_codon:yes gene_type:complete
MVETWEIEWNSSMLEHGRDLGTMEFIFAKGGTVADMNYVMFDVQDNSWEPLIKAVAERDNSHPDIIRKNLPQQPIFGMPNEQFRPAVPAAGTAVAPNPRAVKQANRAMRSAQAGEAVRGGSTKVGDLAGAGFYGQAAMQAGKNIFQGMKDRRAARAADTSKEGGMRQRMGNFMGKVGRGISDLRHAPQAAMQSFRDSRARSEDEARRNALETGLGRGQRQVDDAERRNVPGSQGFDENMDRARGAINQQLARDYNINIPTDSEGNPTMTAQDAMRQEIKDIGARREQPKEGFFAGMKRRGDERRARNQAEREGAAYAPSNVVPEKEPEPPAMPKAPTPEAERAADTDIVPKEEEEEFVFNEPQTGTTPQFPRSGQSVEEYINENREGPETGTPPQDAGQPMKVEPETATATEPTFGQRFAGDAGMKLGATAGDRVAGGLDKVYAQHQKTPFANYEDAMQAMLQGGVGTEGMTAAGKFSGKTGKAVEAALMEMGYTPAQAKAIDQAAKQGNPDAKKIVEEAEEEFVFDNPDMASEMADIGAMNLSEDNHEASWDSLLKGLDIR